MRDRHVDLTQAAVQAATAFAWTALPDYLEGRWALRGLKAALASGSVAVLVALDQRRDDDDAPVPSALPEETAAESAAQALRRRPLLLAAGVTTSASGLMASPMVSRALVRRLRARGVRRPHTALGAVTAGLTLAVELGRILTDDPTPTRA